MNRRFCISGWATLAGMWLSCVMVLGQAPDSRQREGLHESPPVFYVIRGATIHVDPTTTIENGSLLIRNTKIIEVGNQVDSPEGAIVVDATGKHVYAGFIDAFLPYGESTDPQKPGPRYWNERIRPDTSIAESYRPAGIRVDDLRRAGITAVNVAPRDGIIRGHSAIVHVADSGAEHLIVASDVALVAELTVSRRGFAGATPAAPGTSRYPSSPMGAYALARQAFYDAQWYHQARQVSTTAQLEDVPEFNLSLERIRPGQGTPLLVQTMNEIAALRAGRFAKEFDLRLIVLGSGNEYRLMNELKQLDCSWILPVDFPAAPLVTEATAALDVTLEALMHWDHAPENPNRLREANIPFSFSTLGLAKPADLLTNVRKAVRRGLDPDAALAALTVNPASLFNVSDRLGTLTPGKFASFLVFDKPVFEDDAKLLESWTAGNRLVVESVPVRAFAGLWRFESQDLEPAQFDVVVRGDTRLSGSVKPIAADGAAGDETKVAAWTTRDSLISGSFDAALWKGTGKAILSFVLDQPEQASGNVILPDGRMVPVAGVRTGDAPPEPQRSGRGGGRPEAGGGDIESQRSERAEGEPSKTDDPQGTAADTKAKKDAQPAMFPVTYPLGDFGRCELPTAPKSVLIHNVTVWTCGPEGVVEDGAILFGDGLVRRVFRPGEPLPTADVVIDGRGGHVTPGLIDCHSHMATDSGINEGTQSITAEVRIGDFVDPRDINIYRQLAGGLTCANILHGSANPIGGQNQVIKLRWGGHDEFLKFAEAPPGIKFALGENVKQSNRREPSSRYPQTRMGVEQIMHDAFRAAQEYDAAHRRWAATRQGLPPRVDLELQALAEIVRGERWIHCHSYRQDEILALIRVLDQFGIRIGTFQHILEGYKVAPEMAAHGAMASAFSDWWAYKFEVYDAIPYAGALMHEAGIVVSFNSDDAELARHMNHEAAKAVRYGGVSEEEALKFVTLNAARQLRIEQWVGSLEPGKHADVVLWNGHPLSTMSRCEQTWIDGRKYFDRDDEVLQVQQQTQQRSALIQRVLESGEIPARGGEGRVDTSLLWPRYDEFCHGHRHSAECWHNRVESTCDACHQCNEDDWVCLFGYCLSARHDWGTCGMGQGEQTGQRGTR